jgi:hypothetical protein
MSGAQQDKADRDERLFADNINVRTNRLIKALHLPTTID